MNFRTLGMLALAAGLALSSVSAFAQEPAATTPAATEATEATATPATPAAPLKLSNKWRIKVREGANNTGTLLFRVTPDKGTATDIVVNIEKGRSENGVATDIKNTFKKVAGPEGLPRRDGRRRGRAGEEAQGSGLRGETGRVDAQGHAHLSRQGVTRLESRPADAQPDVMLSTVTK